MDQTPPEVVIASLAFLIFWLLFVTTILAVGPRLPRLRSFRNSMIAQWRPALAIALLFLVSMGLGGRGWLNPFALAIFCQALFGLAVARSLPGYEPLPMTQAITHHRHIFQHLGSLVGLSLLFAFIALLIGSVGMGIIQQIAGEAHRSGAAVNSLSSNWAEVFFLLLAGAGIAEETTYRLVCVSLFWRWTHRPRLAILLSAILFGIYHLTPLSGMYRTFWQFPVSQFVASTLIGLVWGYAYIKRGYETAVLAHTLSDWVPFILFSAA